MDSEQLKYDLKVMIITECEKEDITPDDIDENIELFSHESGLELDSLDALQISMGIQKNYGLRLADSKEFKRRVTSINELAEFIQASNE